MTDDYGNDMLDALRSELASVAPSAEFQSRVRQRIAGELDLLREELAAVAPSPEFKVRVRQGIEVSRDARAAAWLSGWRWLVPLGAVAAIVIGVVAIFPRTPDIPAQVNAKAPIETPVPIVAPQPTTTVVPPEVRNARDSGLGTRDLGRHASSSEPSLEVITNQPALLRALSARVKAEQALAEASETKPLLEIANDIVIAPIEVNPVVVKWMVEPPLPAGVFPVIRRVTADTAERSQK
jgi:hypothetical protein